MTTLPLTLAFRNVWRNQVRTILVILMIATSIVLLMFFQGFMDGMIHNMIEDTVKSETSDITLYKKGYKADKTLQKGLFSPTPLYDNLLDHPNVQTIFQRLIHDGMIASSHYAQGIRIIGVEPEKEKDHFIISSHIIEGTYGFPKKNTVWIGSQLAKKLQTDIGEKIVITAQTTSGDITGEAFRIQAIFKTDNPKLDRQVVFIPLTQAQSFFQTNNTITQLSISLKNTQHMNTTKQNLQEQVPHTHDIFTWRDLFTSLEFLETTMASYNAITYLIMFTIIAIGIVGVILMSVMERIREFGILMAIGHRFRHISLLIFWESLFMGMIGVLAGIIMGYGLLYLLQQTGIPIASMKSGIDQFGIPLIIYPKIKWGYTLWPLICVSATSTLSIIWPCYILYKQKPIQSIRFH